MTEPTDRISKCVHRSQGRSRVEGIEAWQVALSRYQQCSPPKIHIEPTFVNVMLLYVDVLRHEIENLVFGKDVCCFVVA